MSKPDPPIKPLRSCPHCHQALPSGSSGSGKPGIARARGSARNVMVIDLVADAFGIAPGLILCGDLHRSTCHARHVAMFVLRTAYGMSMPEIATALGQADHTSVHNGLQRVADRLYVDERGGGELKGVIDRLLDRARRWTSDGAVMATRMEEAIPYRLATPSAATGTGGGHG